VTYFSGLHTPAIAAVARQRGDIGLVITPDHSYIEPATDYPAVMVDNGAFSQKGFRPAAFERLLRRIASSEEIRRKLWFVVAPDVVADHTRTLELFHWWEPRIRALGLPVAFVAQNGLEACLDTIPWDRMDTLFIGGDTAWKEGDLGQMEWAQQQGLPPVGEIGHPGYAAWLRMWEEAEARNIPVHMGRVNSLQRMELAHVFYDARSSDGTMLKFQQTDRLEELEGWLDWLNHGTGRLVEPRRKPTRYRSEAQLALGLDDEAA
jgi:hypothetical protein